MNFFGNIDKKILRLSLPAIVSNITVPALGLFDTAISGHLGSEKFLAAIAVGTVMLNVIFWLFGFLRAGTTGLTAVALGKRDKSEIRKVFTRAFFIGVGAGLLLIIFRFPLLNLLSFIIGVEPELENYVTDYFMTRIWGAPALLATIAISGWFIGMQTTVYPLVISVAMNVINIIISFLLVYPMGIGFVGIAAGTALSNYAGLAVSIFCVVHFTKGYKIFSSLKTALQGGGWKKYFGVNSNLFIRSFCIISVTTGLTSAGASLGITALAANVIVMQFFQFFSFFMDGFAFSGEALVGLFFGGHNNEKLKLSVTNLLKWTLAMGLLFTLIYALWFTEISGLLTDSEPVMEEIGKLGLFIILIPIISSWAFIYDGFYIGLTATKFMMLATLIATIAFFIVTYIRLNDGNIVIEILDNKMIWIAFLSYLGIRGLILALIWNPVLMRSMKTIDSVKYSV